MRFVEATALMIAVCSLTAAAPTAVHRQRYSMGTTFDVIVYHEPQSDAEEAVTAALDEVERLDAILSHFKPESDLSTLNRQARHGFVSVDPALYEILGEAIAVSRASGGRFEVTVAPLVRLWTAAHAVGRVPSAAEVSAAKQCVGYQAIELDPPNRVRYRRPCLEIELGGIGKGYAVDRALAVLRSAGIRRAVVNGGSSSIGAIGTPPGKRGWPVVLGADNSVREMLIDNRSLSTSQQDGAIIDAESGAPARAAAIVTVTASSATLADALSTALVLMTKADGAKLIERFPGVSAEYHGHAR